MSDNREILIREAIRNAELFLQSQQAIALSSDQRAINLCGFFIAASTVLAGLSISDNVSSVLSFFAMLLCAALVFAARLAFLAAQPSKFNVLGYAPSVWAEDIEEDKAISEAREEMLASFDRRIDANNILMDRNGNYIKKSVTVAGISVLVSIVAMMLTIMLSSN